MVDAAAALHAIARARTRGTAVRVRGGALRNAAVRVACSAGV